MSEKKFIELAPKLLDDDKLNNLLEFCEFLKNIKVQRGQTATKNLGVAYHRREICSLRLGDDFWYITFFKDYYRRAKLFEKCEEYFTGELKEFILGNINITPGLVTSCKNCDTPKDKTILGKKFDAVCNCHQIVLKNPDGKTLEYAKEIVSIAKNVVDDIVSSNTK